VTNSVAVAGIVLIKVGVNPLYKAPIPSCRAISLDPNETDILLQKIKNIEKHASL